MQEYRNLWVVCNEVEAKNFYNSAVAYLAENNLRWSVDTSRKEYYSRIDPFASERVLFVKGVSLDDCGIMPGLEVTICITYAEACSYANGESGLQVTNIVPTAGRTSLTISEYNSILRRFYDEVISGLSCQNLRWIMSDGYCTIADFVNCSSAELFVRFAETANKSCAATHPQDRHMWNEFLISYISDTSSKPRELTADLLRRLLVEDYGWLSDAAFQLALDFESGVELLRQYNER